MKSTGSKSALRSTFMGYGNFIMLIQKRKNKRIENTNRVYEVLVSVIKT